MNAPRIETINQKKLAGKRMRMSLVNNRTGELWRSFMLQRGEFSNAAGTDLYSLQVYAPGHFLHFSPAAEFEKWALTEVRDFEGLPPGMEPFTLPGGMYAVFTYKGPSSGGPQVFQHIFGTWLPASEFLLDERPHFELLGANYKNGDPESEEEFWIPVRPKKQDC